jgi:hypothetical protein
MALRDRDNPLFFRADGGLDLAQFLLLLIVVWVMAVFTLAGLQHLKVSTAAWAFLGSFTSLCFIAWAARDRAELIANSKTPGEIAKGIASAVPDTPADRETLVDRGDD